MKVSALFIASVGAIIALHAAPANAQLVRRNLAKTSVSTSSPTSDALGSKSSKGVFGKSSKGSKPACDTSGAASFVGTYSDPNHPGGTREIILIDGACVGDYQLAEIYGIGGTGEPKKFLLSAVALGDRKIIIDFTGKGAPLGTDIPGVLEEDGGITFPDGNTWPRED